MNAFMTNFDIDTAEHRTPKWEGLSEIDQAIRDNRVMECNRPVVTAVPEP